VEFSFRRIRIRRDDLRADQSGESGRDKRDGLDQEPAALIHWINHLDRTAKAK
jgi:hypothetical protein